LISQKSFLGTAHCCDNVFTIYFNWPDDTLQFKPKYEANYHYPSHSQNFQSLDILNLLIKLYYATLSSNAPVLYQLNTPNQE